MNLLFFEHGRDRNHDGKFAWIALVIIRHGDDGFGVMSGDCDLRGFVEKLRVRLSDIETTERLGCGEQCREPEQYQTDKHYASYLPTGNVSLLLRCRMRFLTPIMRSQCVHDSLLPLWVVPWCRARGVDCAMLLVRVLCPRGLVFGEPTTPALVLGMIQRRFVHGFDHCR